MIRIRLFEEKVSELKLKGLISGPVHTCIGQEAVSAGVCLALSQDDYIIGNHRSHGHLIAKGTDVKSLMADIFKGSGSSMHVKDTSIGAICSTAIVGSGLPLACGVAFASKYKNDGKITCVFFGDGAANEGSFYESINLSSLWRLPIIFLLENNGVSVTTTIDRVSFHNNLEYRAVPFEIDRQTVYGQDVNSVFDTVKRAKDNIKRNNKPVLIEVKTSRFHEHQEGLAYEKMKDTGYRDNKEVEYWIKNRDPIRLYTEKLIKGKVINQYDIDQIYSEESQRIDNAVEFAKEKV